MSGLSLYIPLGILGLVRWLSWVVRRIPAALYRPVVNDHREAISIVTPVYQEDPRTFALAIESWLANDVVEVICVIDETDPQSMEVASRYPVTVITTNVPGKRDALRVGWEAATTSIVALVDADTVWNPDVAEKVSMPFEDPNVGAVCTRQNVLAPTTAWEILNDIYLDLRYFDESPSQTFLGRAVSCVSGRTAVYRRELLLKYSYRFMNEVFLGVPCMSGDDKRLTTLVLEGGHKTVLQRSARVWSTFPKTASTFFKQRLRWARNTWRSDLRALGSKWVWQHKFLAYWMIDKAVSTFTLLLAPTFMTIILLHHDWLVAELLGIWWLVSRSAKLLPHLERHPARFFIVPFFIVASMAMALVKLAALVTVRKQKWLTRDVEVSVVTKQVVRTPKLAADA